MELKGKKMNCLGDSITAGVGPSEHKYIYFNLIKEQYGLAEARNYGISGTRIASQKEDTFYGGPAFCERYVDMDDDADIIVVFGGTNDFGHGYAPLGQMSDRTIYTYYGAWHVLLKGLMEKYPRGTIVVMTPMHCLTENNPSVGNGKPLRTYIEIMKEVCEYYSVPVLDLFAVSGIQPMVDIHRELYMQDGLHPNNAGHEIIASRLAGFLKAL